MLAWNEMRRRTSLLLVFLLIVILIAVIALFFFVVQQDRSTQQSSPSNQVSSPPTRSAPENRQQSPSTFGSTRTPMQAESCSTLGVACASTYFQSWQEPAEGSCHPSISNGYPVPDPRCTPGGINSTVTLSVMQDPGWRTRCIRDCEESQARKHVAYSWYQIENPQHNSGSNQICELDHLVPLELGGADGMGNIWPQCGPDDATLKNRYFKLKDRVENYLADEVKAGRMSLDAAQRGIASDWTQYLDEANRYCANGGRC
jgi:hypothetical protein